MAQALQEPFDHALALRRFAAAKQGWEDVRKAYAEDARYVNVLGGQWDKNVKAKRDASGKPALEFNELHTYVQQTVNRARQNRPQPKVDPGDDESTQETAEFLSGRLLHIQYASQADVAYDTAVECAATGGWGFYGIDTEYVDNGKKRGGKPSPNQEPRIRRILDPMGEFPDPAVREPDFSDARFWFSREWISRDAYKTEFGGEPMPFDSDDSGDWAQEEQVCIAQYWTVTEKKRRYVWLEDGTEGYDDEVEQSVTDPETGELILNPETGEEIPLEVVNERDVSDRKVECHLIDGQRKLKTTPWAGDWIPRVPVLAREVVVDGQRHLVSLIRFARGPQKLKNAYKSAVANLAQLASTAPWTGPRGMFKDGKWRNAHQENYAFLEWDLVYDKNSQVVPAKPERNTYEAPIQALSAAAIQCSDDIKRAVGYSDSVLQPSKADLSGVAVQRRQEGVNLTNYHLEDNLVRSQWHCARIVLDLDLKLNDTPRVLRARKEDGTSWAAPVTMAGDDGNAPQVPGYEDKTHHRLDQGMYDVVVTSGPGYATRREAERDFLLESLRGNPQAWTLYADRIFSLLGFRDLEERAKLALPPAIQQAMQAHEAGVPPQVQAQLVRLTQENQQLQSVVQKVITMLQTKQLETKGKLDVEKLKLIREVMVTSMQHAHDASGQLVGHHFDAAKHLMDMLHETELAPAPAAPGALPSAA